MPYKLHQHARLTPHQRRYIQENPDGLSASELARKFGVSRTTIYKWKRRDFVTDLPSVPVTPFRALDEVQQAVIALLREKLHLSGDDLLRLVQTCLGWTLSRATLYRYLNRLGLTQKKKKRQREWKAFEQVQDPGFLHIDVYYLPRIAKERRYLYVAIDRATRCAWVMLAHQKNAHTAVKFVRECLQAFPFKVHTLLTDNGKEFTDAYGRGRKRPTGQHPFDKACRQWGIKHKRTRPRSPQTNGLVERLIGKIDQHVVKKYRATSIHDLFCKIVQFMLCYHYSYHSVLQTSPIEKLSESLQNKDPAVAFIEKIKHITNLHSPCNCVNNLSIHDK